MEGFWQNWSIRWRPSSALRTSILAVPPPPRRRNRQSRPQPRTTSFAPSTPWPINTTQNWAEDTSSFPPWPTPAEYGGGRSEAVPSPSAEVCTWTAAAVGRTCGLRVGRDVPPTMILLDPPFKRTTIGWDRPASPSRSFATPNRRGTVASSSSNGESAGSSGSRTMGVAPPWY